MSSAYAARMRQDAVVALADNVRRLMADRGDTQVSLSKRANISQRAVGDLLTYGKGHFKNPTVKTVAAIANALDISPWLLMFPNLPLDLLRNNQVEKLIANFAEATEPGRANICHVAEGEVRYAVADKVLKKT